MKIKSYILKENFFRRNPILLRILTGITSVTSYTKWTNASVSTEKRNTSTSITTFENSTIVCLNLT